jgi:hypothetical protein
MYTIRTKERILMPFKSENKSDDFNRIIINKKESLL